MCDLICKNLMDILRADMLARAIVERKTWVKFKNKFLNSMKEGVNRKNYDRTSTLIRNLLHISIVQLRMYCKKLTNITL